jgi:eukaryotic-like serine/threonine-protein kinase
VDSAHFRRLMDLVGDALELPEAEREKWLAARTGDDRELIDEVRVLLAGASTDELDALTESLEDRVIRAARWVAGGRRTPPERVGPYAVRTVLGEGGMGVVYGARQEEPLRRDVALKVLHPGTHAPLILARFESERRTLASLDHPCIAHVYDAGTTEEGLPWFAMEWVRGEPLTKYCDQHRMGLEKRLALFQKVLSAVHYAHQKAVIHRDLKPSNVLVTEIDGEPVPKVIDFGIARVDGDATGLTTAHTAVGAVLGTLEYMSPEQALAPAAGVGTPSDIYSLGVLLYELVTGLLPFPGRTLRTAIPTELERLLRDTEPPPPSRKVGVETDGDAAGRAQARGTDARRLSRALRGDLDNIVGMAMRKDPALRYSSVAQFSEDIQRLLEGRPVIARPATWSYRARRFIGRHRWGVMGSAAAVLAVTGMAATFTYHLAVERDRALTEAKKALQVTDFLQEIFRVSDPLSGNEGDVSARQLLDQAAERIATELGDQPEVRASLLGVMGMTYFGLGARDAAVRRLEEAVAVERSLHRGAHPDVATRLLELGTVQGELGNLGPSEEALREALALRRDLLGQRHAATAVTMTRLATTLRGRGEYGEAERIAREALGIQRLALGASHPDIAASLHALAFILRSQGRLREAEVHYREALEMRRALLHPRARRRRADGGKPGPRPGGTRRVRRGGNPPAGGRRAAP